MAHGTSPPDRRHFDNHHDCGGRQGDDSGRYLGGSEGCGCGQPGANGASFNSVEGSATASGLAGATVTVTAGSSVGRSASATSAGKQLVDKTDVTPGAKASSTEVVTTTKLGKAATITNEAPSARLDLVSANAIGTTTATVTNSATGRINGSVTAGALPLDSVQTVTDNDINNLDRWNPHQG